MAETAGLYTVGSGGDYSNWAAAIADTGGLTGELEHRQISDVTDNAAFSVNIALNGHTYKWTTNKRHYGNFQGGWLTTLSMNLNKANAITITNSSVGAGANFIIDGLNMVYTGATITDWCWGIFINTATTNVKNTIKNLLFDAGGKDVICLRVQHNNAVVDLYNSVFANGVGATGKYAQGVTVGLSGSGIHTSSVWANITVHGFTGAGYVYGFRNAANVAFTLTNVAVFDCTLCYAYGSTATAGLGNTIATKCASSDATGSEAGLLNLTTADQFLSTNILSRLFLKLKNGSALQTGGTAPTLSTVGVNGVVRPYTDSTYSIGANEYFAYETTINRTIGTKAAYSTGTIAVDATGTILTLSGGSFDANWGAGDQITIGVGAAVPETLTVKTRDSATQLTLCCPCFYHGQSGLSYSIGRAYSTKAAWVAGEAKDLTVNLQIDKGLMCKDSTFSGVVTVTGWTASATYYPELTVASHSQMSGKAIGTGVVVDRNNASGNVINIAQNYFRVSGFEIKNVVNSVGSVRVIYVDGSTNYIVRIENMIVHDVSTSAYMQMIHNNNAASGSIVRNCLIYNGSKTGAGAGAIVGLFGSGSYEYDNITVYNVNVASGATGTGTGVDGSINEFSNPVFRNIISTDCDECFKNHSGAAALNNISSDETAKGADYQHNIAASNLFNSIVSGSEDFRLKSTSPAKGAGYDLSGTFTTDIVLTSRTIPWDVGCFKFIEEVIFDYNIRQKLVYNPAVRRYLF